MNNISKISNCYGCGVCSISCPKKIIEIKLNDDGFYQPYISDRDICNHCGLCLKVCSFNKTEIALKDNSPQKSYAGWINNKEILRSSSSGGIIYAIGKQLLKNDYKICGVKYNNSTHRAEHYISNTEIEFSETKGSKYIQSYTINGFKNINKKDKYLIIGTPCQIDSFRRFAKIFRIENNFILLDFFCHSVPSMLAWQYYIKKIEKKIGKIKSVEWRNKQTGWHDSWAMYIVGENDHQYRSRLSQGDIFYKLFLGDYCCNPACQKECKYKYKNSSADIRVGDLWGNTYSKNESGVSAIVTFTQKGTEIINSIKDTTIIEHNFDTVAEGQMKKNAGKAYLNKIVIRLLKSTYDIPFYIFKLIFTTEKILRLPSRIINKLSKILRQC